MQEEELGRESLQAVLALQRLRRLRAREKMSLFRITNPHGGVTTHTVRLRGMIELDNNQDFVVSWLPNTLDQ